MLPQLCLHRGGQEVNDLELRAVPVPARTASWVPVAHHTLLDRVTQSLSESGLSVVGSRHALSKEGARYFGLLEVKGGPAAPDYGMVVGVRNSHDMTFPAGLALGSRVFVCDNLAFSSEVVLKRKHTSMIERDLPGVVMTAIARLVGARGDQDKRIATYKQREFTNAQAHDLLIRAVDARALPIKWLMTALSEWRKPRHVEFEADGQSGWRLFNAVTEALKGSSDLHALPGRTGKLHGLLDAACGVLTHVVDGEERLVRRVEAEPAPELAMAA